MPMLGLLITVFAVVSYLAVSLPASGRIPRGGLVGLRTPSTKRSDAAWLAAHRAALPLTTGVTLVTGLYGIVVACGWSPLDLTLEHTALIGLAILVGGLLVATTVADKAAREVTTETTAPEPGTGHADDS